MIKILDENCIKSLIAEETILLLYFDIITLYPHKGISMRYFLISLLTFIVVLTACSKKNLSSSTIDSSTVSRTSDYTEMGADISPSVIPSPVISPSPSVMPSPVMSASVEADVAVSTSREEPTVVMPVPQPREVQSGILTAADIDDNLNLSYFQKYVNKLLQSMVENTFPFMNTKDRVKLTIVDANNRGINRVHVKIDNFSGYTNSAGVLYIFPSVDNIPMDTTIEINGKSKPIKLNSKKEFTITLNRNQELPKSLDLMFVVDTTGSMGDEMRYLAKEFDAIVSSVEEKHPNVNIRFGLTLYRDKGDDYVVRDFDFTADKNKMKNQLEQQSANGGGDYPEAMDEGIEKALEASWKAEDGVRMMFVVADAPPHDEKIKQMVPIIEKARAMGIHIYPLGASGVAKKAEYLMRHLALFTSGRYLWLTDDSGVGNSHEEPKVSCYQVTRLDQLLSRVIQSELSGKRIEADKASIVRTFGQYDKGICQ